MRFEVVLDAGALIEGCDELLLAIERATFEGLDEAARITAAAARARHPYQNRTGDLEASTQAVEAEGDVWSDHAQSAVAATMPYAGFVNERRPFLEPAWDAVSGTATHAFEVALARACQ